MISRAAWAAFGMFAVLALAGLAPGLAVLQQVGQPLAATALVIAYVATVRAWVPTTILTGVGVVLAWAGDTLPPHLPFDARLSAGAAFLAAVCAYSAALVPGWLHQRDGLRTLLAVPYAGVVIGLVVACQGGAGRLAVPMLVYAVALTLMAFLASGVNSLTWIGGTMFLLSSSVLGMSWFLPGASVPHIDTWVMASYFLGHAFLISGVLQAAPAPRPRSCPEPAGARLVILEG